MYEKAKPARDAFTFSLGGISLISPVIAAPVVADDRINKVLDEQRSRVRGDQSQKPNRWLSFRRHATQGTCA